MIRITVTQIKDTRARSAKALAVADIEIIDQLGLPLATPALRLPQQPVSPTTAAPPPTHNETRTCGCEYQSRSCGGATRAGWGERR